MTTVKVNIGSDGTVGLAPSTGGDDDAGCECNKDSWPLIILCLGFGTSFLVCLVGVLSILQLQSIVLSVYIILLSLVGLMAELRRIKCLRGIFYHVLKFVYFLTNYYCRGAYHIFIGSILLSDVPLVLIAGCVSMAFGILLIVVHTVVGLPNYVDPQVAKEEAARVASIVPGTTPIASAAYSPAATPTAANNENPYASKSAPTGYYATPQPSAYEPAPASSASLGTGAYVPPATNTAYMAQGTIEDPYDEEPITSATNTRAQRQNNDDALAAAYYAQQQAAAAQPTRANKNIDFDDPFARDDSQYRPNRQ